MLANLSPWWYITTVMQGVNSPTEKSFPRKSGGPHGLGDWIDCACGCGQKLTKLDKRGRSRVTFPGHARRGKSNTWSIKPDHAINYWTAHERARKLFLERGPCELVLIGGCSKKTNIHHIDGNPWNNDRRNLIQLCYAHHAMVESGWIDLRWPRMPSYWLFPSGRRVYTHDRQGDWILNPSRRRRSTSEGVLMTFLPVHWVSWHL